MVRLSDSQAVILGAACQRADRSVYPLTTKLPGAAAAKVLQSLLKKGFIEEVQARPKDTVWREDKKRRRLTLRATPAGFEALGSEQSEPPSGADVLTETDAVGSTSRKAKKGKAKEKAAPATRANSKQAQLIEMLKSRDGVTIDEIVKKFDWQAHTVRGALAGALKKKLGLNLISDKIEGRGRVYRIAE
jgi:Fic family protein